MDLAFQYSRMTEAEFTKFSTLIFAKTGIHLKPEKKELLNARLGKRLRASKISSFSDYYKYLTNDTSGNELVHLINSVSTNFTSFFREQAHFDFLTSSVLPGYAHSKTLKVWSAACSSGEEPYTLAMVIANFLGRGAVRPSILATDISTKVLGVAQKGIYSNDKVDKVPAEFLRSFFQKGVGQCAGYVKAKEELRRIITFQRINLMEPFPWKDEMDIIFCRNVMIYFTRETQQELAEKFYNCLAPGGYLFIGHSESLTSVNHRFKQAATTVYRKG